MLNKQALLQAYRKMREIRTFEERLHQENTSGDIPGFIHLYTGEEAIAVGVCENLTTQILLVQHTVDMATVLLKVVTFTA